MNKVIMMGRLTRDPEVRYSSGENSMAIAKFSIAVDRRNRRQQTDDQPTADFFNCTAFGKQGEFVEKYLKKGTKILLTGRVQNDNYTNKNGEKIYSVQIIVEEIEFAESKKDSVDSKSGAQPQADAPTADGGGDGFMNIPDSIQEELPFN